MMQQAPPRPQQPEQVLPPGPLVRECAGPYSLFARLSPVRRADRVVCRGLNQSVSSLVATAVRHDDEAS